MGFNLDSHMHWELDLPEGILSTIMAQIWETLWLNLCCFKSNSIIDQVMAKVISLKFDQLYCHLELDEQTCFDQLYGVCNAFFHSDIRCIIKVHSLIFLSTVWQAQWYSQHWGNGVECPSWQKNWAKYCGKVGKLGKILGSGENLAKCREKWEKLGQNWAKSKQSGRKVQTRRLNWLCIPQAHMFSFWSNTVQFTHWNKHIFSDGKFCWKILYLLLQILHKVKHFQTLFDMNKKFMYYFLVTENSSY